MKRIFLAAVALVSIIAACQQAPVEYVHSVDTLYIRDTLHVPDTNALKLKGTLHGRAGLYGPSGLVADNSGIKVSMDGTAYSATTDSAGTWTMRDLPTGSYNIIFNREGYEPYKVFGYYFMGGADSYFLLPDAGVTVRQCYPVLISHLDPVVISNISIKKSIVYPNTWLIRGQVSHIPPALSKVFYFGRDPGVSTDSGAYVLSSIVSIAGDGTWEIKSTELTDNGFQQGETVFLTCYTNYLYLPSYPAIASYWDPYSKSVMSPGTIMTARSNVMSFTLP